MPPNDRLIADLAAAVLDGAVIDWTAADSNADEVQRPLLAQLRLLSSVADRHRKYPVPLSAALDDWPDAPDPARRLATPSSWGHLRVLERIGGGAFGEVYRAWDMRLDREVALKLMPSTFQESRESSIIEEGRLLARVRHPNVVTIYGADRIDDRVGLWMEFLRGRTLQQAIEEGRVFTPAEAASIGTELCRAIEAVHGAGLLHRDIKPHNVMVTDDGRVVLMDFGAGRELDAAASASLAGTPLYLAPELLLRGADPTAASDLYSLGVLLFYLLTRSYPVRAKSLADLRLAHEERERLDIRELRPDVPSKLARIIRHATDPQSERQYQSAGQFEADLARVTGRSGRVAAAAAAILILAAAASMRGWQQGWYFTAAALGTGHADSPHERPVIAVLPLKDLSPEPGNDYFADGLTDEILRNLAVIRGLEVRSRTSSFAFRDTPRNLREIGAQLGANLIVEGSVLRSGNRLRVNAQLVQVAGDVPLWADRFDRELKDVFAIQDEISRVIVNRLRLTLGKGQRRYDVNPEAYELYLKARASVARRSAFPALRAAQLFEQVIAIDSSYAPAYAGLADAYAAATMDIQGDLRPGSSMQSGIANDRALALIRSSAETALQLDPLLAEAHAATGLLHARERDWQAAEAAFQRAIDLDPSLTAIHVNYVTSTLVPLGKLDEAERVLQAASRVDPLSLTVRRTAASLDIVLGRYDRAIDGLLRIEMEDPSLPYVDLALARALTFAGRLPEALVRWERLDVPGRHCWMARAYVMAGRRAWVERIAAEHQHPYRLAMIYAALGEKDRALDALDQAADIVPQRVAPLTMYPELASLRDDPRFAGVRRKLGLP